MSQFRRVLVLVAIGVLSGGQPAARGEDRRPEPLPAELRAAWAKVGAEAGWMSVSRYGSLLFRRGAEGQVGEVPAFKLSVWREGILAGLPQRSEPLAWLFWEPGYRTQG